MVVGWSFGTRLIDRCISYSKQKILYLTNESFF